MFQQFYAGSDLMTWPLVGLGIFFLSFVAVLLYVLVGLRGSRTVERMARLPLDDDDLLAPEMEASDNG